MQIENTALRAQWARLVRKIGRAAPGTYEPLAPSQAPPLTIFCGGGPVTRICFFTKDVLCRRWLYEGVFPRNWIALSRHSIPGRQYLEEIVAHVERARLPLFFVGDLDPLDLTVFVMLRDALRAPPRQELLTSDVGDGFISDDAGFVPGDAGINTIQRGRQLVETLWPVGW